MALELERHSEVSPLTTDLHSQLIDALQPYLIGYTDINQKPLELDLTPPLPSRLRCYVYSLVRGGSSREREYKAVLRVAGQPVGEYGSFDFSGDRNAIALALRKDLAVWVLWDAMLHPQFKNGGNIQVHRDTVLTAAATGWAEQLRRLSDGTEERVIACQSTRLAEALRQRVLGTTLPCGDS